MISQTKIIAKVKLNEIAQFYEKNDDFTFKVNIKCEFKWNFIGIKYLNAIFSKITLARKQSRTSLNSLEGKIIKIINVLKMIPNYSSLSKALKL